MVFWTAFTKKAEVFRSLPLVSIVFSCCLPLSFWVNVFLGAPFSCGPLWSIQFKTVHNVVYAVAFLILALLSRKLRVLHRSGPIAIGSTVSFMAGALILSLVPTSGHETVALLGLLLSGFGGAAQMLIWLELMGRIPSHQMISAYSITLVLTPAIWLFISSTPKPIATLAIILLPLFCMLALLYAFTELGTQDEELWMENETPPAAIATFWRLFVWKTVIALAFAFCSVRLSPSSLMATDLITAALFLGLVVVLRERFDFSVFFRLSMPLVFLGLLVSAISASATFIAQLFCCVGSSLALTISFVVICNNSYRNHFTAAYPAGLLLSINTLTIILGGILRRFLESSQPPGSILHAGVVIILCVVCVLISVFVFNEDHFYASWRRGWRAQEPQSEDPGSLDTSVASLADEVKLSNRECEVILLAARGKTNGEIATELFISPGTVSAHISNIYSKLGIHDRKALMALIEEYRRNSEHRA